MRAAFQTAVKLINSAHKCSVDAVKFQTFKTEKFISSSNIENFNKYKDFELSHDEFYKLSIAKKELKFISTPFDLESAEFLNLLNKMPLKLHRVIIILN